MEALIQICMLKGKEMCRLVFAISCIVFSFHNQLKTVYLNGRVNRRVDYLIYHLLEFEKDAYFRYMSVRQLPPAVNKKMKEDQSRHLRGMQIPREKVEVITHKNTCIYICTVQ